MKQINQHLTQFLQVIKNHRLRKLGSHSNYTVKHSKEEKIKLKSSEEQNYEKMLANMQEEYEKTRKRMLKVQDHKYIIKLRSEISKSKEVISKLETDNMQLKSTQFNKDKKMNEILTRGKNDAMSEIHTKLKELTVLEERNRQLDIQLESQAKAEKDVVDQTQVFEESHSILRQKAKTKGVSQTSKSMSDDNAMKMMKYKRVSELKKKIEMNSYKTTLQKLASQKHRVLEILTSYNEIVDSYNSEVKVKRK